DGTTHLDAAISEDLLPSSRYPDVPDRECARLAWLLSLWFGAGRPAGRRRRRVPVTGDAGRKGGVPAPPASGHSLVVVVAEIEHLEEIADGRHVKRDVRVAGR